MFTNNEKAYIQACSRSEDTQPDVQDKEIYVFKRIPKKKKKKEEKKKK